MRRQNGWYDGRMFQCCCMMSTCTRSWNGDYIITVWNFKTFCNVFLWLFVFNQFLKKSMLEQWKAHKRVHVKSLIIDVSRASLQSEYSRELIQYQILRHHPICETSLHQLEFISYVITSRCILWPRFVKVTHLLITFLKEFIDIYCIMWHLFRDIIYIFLLKIIWVYWVSTLL